MTKWYLAIAHILAVNHSNLTHSFVPDARRQALAFTELVGELECFNSNGVVIGLALWYIFRLYILS